MDTEFVKMKNVLLVLLIVSSIATAWSCSTHQYICDEAGLSNLDCCYADREQEPLAFYHHCASNTTDCKARTFANKYLNSGPEYNMTTEVKTQIWAHLISDSYCPVHWESLTSKCHSEFEDKVESMVEKQNYENWTVTTTCNNMTFTASKSDLLAISNALTGVQPDTGIKIDERYGILIIICAVLAFAAGGALRITKRR